MQDACATKTWELAQTCRSTRLAHPFCSGSEAPRNECEKAESQHNRVLLSKKNQCKSSQRACITTMLTPPPSFRSSRPDCNLCILAQVEKNHISAKKKLNMYEYVENQISQLFASKIIKVLQTLQVCYGIAMVYGCLWFACRVDLCCGASPWRWLCGWWPRNGATAQGEQVQMTTVEVKRVKH